MVNMSRLSNKVAIVTGASKGIGGGIATALGAAGARVAVNYSSDRESAERVAQAITDDGGEAIAVGADVSKAAEVARLFKEVDSAFGRLDVLVNNAGVFRFGAFAEITEETFHLHYNINVLGAILTVQEAIKRFGAGGGSIINLSSIVGPHPVAGALLYASTKGAIETLTRGLALELAPRKIRVNAIAPGHTETEGNAAAGTFEGGAGAVLAGKTPLGRLGRVTDIAPLAVFLASDESAWITGEFIPEIDFSSFGNVVDPGVWSQVHDEGVQLLENITYIRVPVIAAIEGRAHVHSEYALLADVIVAGEGATFHDVPHFAGGIVPGDGIFTT
jgi:3-oxoacyl-[acyl-carrier protein] reductase